MKYLQATWAEKTNTSSDQHVGAFLCWYFHQIGEVSQNIWSNHYSDLTPNGGLEMEIPPLQGNLGWNLNGWLHLDLSSLWSSSVYPHTFTWCSCCACWVVLFRCFWFWIQELSFQCLATTALSLFPDGTTRLWVPADIPIARETLFRPQVGEILFHLAWWYHTDDELLSSLGSLDHSHLWRMECLL